MQFEVFWWVGSHSSWHLVACISLHSPLPEKTGEFLSPLLIFTHYFIFPESHFLVLDWGVPSSLIPTWYIEYTVCGLVWIRVCPAIEVMLQFLQALILPLYLWRQLRGNVVITTVFLLPLPLLAYLLAH